METRIKTARFVPEEKETHLWYDPIDHVWKMDSNISKHCNKAVKQGWNVVSEAVYDDGTVCAMILTAPDGAITIRDPNKKRNYELTEEHKAKLLNSRNKNNRLNKDFEDE